MAEAGTLSGVVFDDPADADNSPFAIDGAGPDAGDGSAAPVEGQGQPATSSALEQRLADLERTSQRHREQLTGSQQEVQRLLEQNKLLSQQNQEFLTAFRDMLKTPGPSSAPAPTPTAPPDPTPLLQEIDLKRAMEKAVLENDYSEVTRLQQQLGTLLSSLATRRDPPPQEALRPEQIQELVRSELSRTTAQQQAYQRMVTAMAQRHPFLADPRDPLYAEVWQAYDEAMRNPFTQTVYGEPTPQYTVEMPAPAGQGWGSKAMDMRVLNDVALEVRAKHAATQARRETTDRRESPTLDTAGREPRSARTPSMLFYEGEIANMQELLRTGIRGPKTMDEFKKYRWEKLISPDEKQRRLALWRAGKWDGK